MSGNIVMSRRTTFSGAKAHAGSSQRSSECSLSSPLLRRDDVDHPGESVAWGQWAITSNDPDFRGRGASDSGEDYGPAPGATRRSPSQSGLGVGLRLGPSPLQPNLYLVLNFINTIKCFIDAAAQYLITMVAWMRCCVCALASLCSVDGRYNSDGVQFRAGVGIRMRVKSRSVGF